MERNYSRDALLRFLSTLGERGLANQNTAEGLRVAVTKILGELPEDELRDVRELDVEEAIHRFHNRNPGAVTPGTLAEYQRRIALAIRHFVSFTENPTGFRPIGRGASKRNGGDKKNGAEKPRDPKLSRNASTPPAADNTAVPSPATAEPQPATGLTIPYPLRADFLAQVVIPRDLKRDEARRLSAFITTLASDFTPEANT